MSRLDDYHPVERPSLAESIRVLLYRNDTYGVAPTDEDVDVAEVVRHVDSTHRGDQVCDNPTEPDPFNRTWGTCTACAEPWPCPAWSDAQSLALLFAGRAHNRSRARAAQVLARIRDRKETA